MDVFILPHDELVLAQVVDVVHRRLWVELEHQPTDVRPHEALGNVVGVLVVIDVLVVAAVVGRPVEAGVFKGAGTEDQGEETHRPLGLEGEVREQPVVAQRDAHHGGHQVKSEHRELEPIDAKLEEVDGQADDGNKCGANEERTGNPVHPVEGNAIHGMVGCVDFSLETGRHRE